MNEFQKILKIIGRALDNFSGTSSDSDSGKSLETEIIRRDKEYTKLLNEYVNITQRRNKIKENHKWIFFWFVVVSCAIVLFFVGKTICKILSSDDYEIIIQSIPIIIAAFVSCITAVIAIPLAITNFLFNTKEDDNIVSIIQHMQDHDLAGITLLKERFGGKVTVTETTETDDTVEFSDSDNS